jgi:DNA-binding MarR family transcriptional regulator
MVRMSSRTNPTVPSERATLDLALRLGQAHAALAKRFDRGLSSHHGLSYGDFVLLSHLGAAPGGRLRRIDLAEAVGLTASGVTRALGPLERIGVVEREANPRDARVAYASLTGAGRQLLADAQVTAERVAAHAFIDRGWSAEDVATLVDLLARLDAPGLPTPVS